MLKQLSLAGLFTAAALLPSPTFAATVSVDSSALINGYVNVFELPSNGGGFVFGSGWAPADLATSFSNSTTVTLAVNSVNDTNPFWYSPSGGPGSTGNKIVEANLYAETNVGTLGDTSLTFEGIVLSNTFGPSHTVSAFIRDFAPDFSSFNSQTVALSPGGFTVTLALINDAARHVQYGFTVTGPTVWITDAASFGTTVVTAAAVPEPSSYALLAAAATGMFVMTRRRRAKA